MLFKLGDLVNVATPLKGFKNFFGKNAKVVDLPKTLGLDRTCKVMLPGERFLFFWFSELKLVARKIV